MLSPKQPTYRVKRGDTLSDIAKSQYGNSAAWPEIAKANRVPAKNLILVGALLRLPPVRLDETSMPGANASSSLADIRARPVAFPAVKYNFTNLPSMVMSTPQADYKLALTGAVTLQQKGSMTEIEVTNSWSLDGKLKSEYDSKFLQLAGNVDINWSPLTPGRAGITCGFTTATKVNGEAFVSQQFTFTPLNTYKFSLAPKPISGEYQDLVFAGSMGYELEVDVKYPDLSLSMPAISTEAATVTLEALFVSGAALIVSDLVFNAGALSWVAAVALAL